MITAMPSHAKKTVGDLSDPAVYHPYSHERTEVHPEGTEVGYGSYADKVVRLHASQPRTHSALGHRERRSDAAVAPRARHAAARG